MPVADPSSGRTFIWLITCILFISIFARGGCLVAYLVLPESQIASWVPDVGVTLVFLPWAFWVFTFLYRIFSRCCGFRLRVSVPNINNNGGGDQGGRGGSGGAANNAPVDDDKKAVVRTLSIASHESEMPLAKSMAS